jgi:hypothetical protein
MTRWSAPATAADGRVPSQRCAEGTAGRSARVTPSADCAPTASTNFAEPEAPVGTRRTCGGRSGPSTTATSPEPNLGRSAAHHQVGRHGGDEILSGSQTRNLRGCRSTSPATTYLGARCPIGPAFTNTASWWRSTRISASFAAVSQRWIRTSSRMRVGPDDRGKTWPRRVSPVQRVPAGQAGSGSFWTLQGSGRPFCDQWRNSVIFGARSANFESYLYKRGTGRPKWG